MKEKTDLSSSFRAWTLNQAFSQVLPYADSNTHSPWQLGERTLGSSICEEEEGSHGRGHVSEWGLMGAFNRDVPPHCSQPLLGMVASFGKEWGDWLVSSMDLGFGEKGACASCNCLCSSLVTIVLLLFSLNRPCCLPLWILISLELG